MILNPSSIDVMHPNRNLLNVREKCAIGRVSRGQEQARSASNLRGQCERSKHEPMKQTV